MKKFLAVLLVLVMLVSLSACAASGAGASGGEDIEATFKLGLTFTMDDYRGEDVAFFTNLVTERSGGKIQFELFPSESLVQGREALQGVTQGLIDMYMVGSTYIAGMVPSVAVTDFPQLAARDLEETLQFTYDLMTGDSFPIYEEEFRKAGVELIGAIGQSGTTEMIFAEPVRSLEDYNGRKIRTVGGVSDQILENIGSTPIFIGSADLYLGLQSGLVDGCMTTANTILTNKLYELCPYLTEPTLGGGLSPYFMIMNSQKFAGLSDNQKEIMKQAAAETLANTVTAYPPILNVQRDEALALFTEVITLDDAEFGRVRDVGINPVWDSILAESDEVTNQLAEIRRKMELGE